MLTVWIPAALRPWAKAINAFGLGITTYVVHGLVSGSWDLNALEALVTTGLLSAVVFATPNGE